MTTFPSEMDVKVEIKVDGPNQAHKDYQAPDRRNVTVLVEVVNASRGDAVVGAIDKAMSGARATLRSALNERI